MRRSVIAPILLYTSVRARGPLVLLSLIVLLGKCAVPAEFLLPNSFKHSVTIPESGPLRYGKIGPVPTGLTVLAQVAPAVSVNATARRLFVPDGAHWCRFLNSGRRRCRPSPSRGV